MTDGLDDDSARALHMKYVKMEAEAEEAHRSARNDLQQIRNEYRRVLQKREQELASNMQATDNELRESRETIQEQNKIIETLQDTISELKKELEEERGTRAGDNDPASVSQLLQVIEHQKTIMEVLEHRIEEGEARLNDKDQQDLTDKIATLEFASYVDPTSLPWARPVLNRQHHRATNKKLIVEEVDNPVPVKVQERHKCPDRASIGPKHRQAVADAGRRVEEEILRKKAESHLQDKYRISPQA